MSPLRMVAALLIALVVHAALPGDMVFRPEPLLLLALAAGAQGGEDRGLLFGAGAGLLMAPLTMEPFGWDAALLGAAGVAGARAARWFRRDQVPVQIVLALAAALFIGIARLVRLEASEADPQSLRLLPALVASALATAAAAPPVFLVLRAAEVFAPRRSRSVSPVL